MFRVLVVEQDWRMSEVLMNILADAGYAVDAASDGGLAVARARARKPNVAVFGRESCARVFLAARANEPALAGIDLVVAASRPRPLEGVAVYLKKPFTMDDLLAGLQRCLEGSERRDGLHLRTGQASPSEPQGTNVL